MAPMPPWPRGREEDILGAASRRPATTVTPPANPVDPSLCPHERSVRLGIQSFPFPPYRVYLLRCHACETTLTTGSLREARRPRSPGSGDGASGRGT
jgi:hypothetical protein